MKEEPRIGFIGLGGMGRGLVQNLCAKGYRVMVHDIDTDKVAAAVEQGATRGDSAAEIAAESDIFAVCVTTAEAVQALALGPEGALARLPG